MKTKCQKPYSVERKEEVKIDRIGKTSLQLIYYVGILVNIAIGFQ